MAWTKTGYRSFPESEEFKSKPLIERNAIKLSDLERDWSTLGPLRSITYTIFFGEEKEVNSFAHDARENGFDVEISGRVGLYYAAYKYEVQATRVMKPTASDVTRWEEWFQTRVNNVPSFEDEEDTGNFRQGAIFEGWSYPKMLSPAFFLKGDKRSRNHQNALGAQERTRVLFGQVPCDFETSNGWSSKKRISKPSQSFQLVPSEFLKVASQRIPSDPEPTASSFSQWLYSLYANVFGDADDRDEGKAAEELIFAERRRAYSSTDYHTMRSQFPDWYLKHNGMISAKNDRPNYYAIQNLKVRGEPLRALPDLVYENRRTGEILIVEIKHSQMDIPNNLWPNIWGQLWCYAQIDEFLHAPKVTVIGEVWGDKWHGKNYQYVYLRASVRRNPRATPFDRFFRTLFDIYRDAV